MDSSKKLSNRKTIRRKDYDYNNEGVYFLTICTKEHKCILSEMVSNIGKEGPSILDSYDCVHTKMTEYGKVVDKYIQQLNAFYDNINVEKYVIMPNHVHILLSISENDVSHKHRISGNGKNVSVISSFVSTFKRFCNKECGENIWQARSYDHIIRNQEDYERHLAYILENPMRWEFDDLKVNDQ